MEHIEHIAAPTGEHDRENYYACQCDCGCDRDPAPDEMCEPCQNDDHMPCLPECEAVPPHYF